MQLCWVVSAIVATRPKETVGRSAGVSELPLLKVQTTAPATPRTVTAAAVRNGYDMARSRLRIHITDRLSTRLVGLAAGLLSTGWLVDVLALSVGRPWQQVGFGCPIGPSACRRRPDEVLQQWDAAPGPPVPNVFTVSSSGSAALRHAV